MKSAYRTLSLIVMNTLVVFLVVVIVGNLVLAATFFVWDRHLKNTNPVSLKYGEGLKKAYPGWSESDLNQMLDENWRRPFLFEPFTQFKERGIQGKFVRVNEQGFRQIPGQGPWPPDPSRFNLFVFGGSTLFGKGLPDEETLPAHLQVELSKHRGKRAVQVYNLARGSYYSSQERILFERLLAEEIKPDLALFIDGLNEFAQVQDAPQASSELAAFVNDPPLRTAVRSVLRWTREWPMARALGSFRTGWMAYLFVRQTDQPRSARLTEAEASRLFDRYLANKRLIEAAGSSYHVRTVFVWQPIPFYRYDPKYYWFEPWASERGAGVAYPVVAERLKKSLPLSNFLWLADSQADAHELLYVDQVHYRGMFCKKLACMIRDFLVDKRMLSVEGAVHG